MLLATVEQEVEETRRVRRVVSHSLERAHSEAMDMVEQAPRQPAVRDS